MTLRKRFQQIVALADQGKLGQAKIMLQEVNQKFPEHRTIWTLLLIYLEAMSALHQQPFDVRGLRNAGTVVMQIPAWFGDRLTSLRRAEAFYRAAIKHNPNLTGLYDQLATLLKTYPDLLGDQNTSLHEAKEFYHEAIRLDPRSALSYNGLANLLSDHAELFDDHASALSEAEANYRIAIDLDPNFPHPHNGLANLLSQHPDRSETSKGSLFEAKYLYKRSIELNPRSAHARNGLANLLMEHPDLFGERDESLHQAEALYREAIKLDPGVAQPGFALPYIGLANLLSANFDLFGDPTECLHEALSHYHLAIARDPGFAPAHIGLANLRLAHPDLFGERNACLDLAATHFRKAIQLGPGDGFPYHGLATLLTQHPDLFGVPNEVLRQAETYFRKAMELNPGLAAPHNGLAILLSSHPDLFGERNVILHQAETQYRRAIQLDLGLAAPWLGLSGLYRRRELKSHRLAGGCFRRFLWLDRMNSPRLMLQRADTFRHPLVYLKALEKLGIELGLSGQRAAEVLAEAEPFLNALHALDQAELGEFERQELRGLVRHLGGDVRSSFAALDELDNDEAAENNVRLQFQLAYLVAQRLGNHQPEREFALSVVDAIEQHRPLTPEEAYYAGCLHLLGDHPVGGTDAVLDALKSDAPLRASASRDAVRQRFEQAAEFLPAWYQLWDLELNPQARDQRMRAILEEERRRAVANLPTSLLYHQPAPEHGVEPDAALAEGIRRCVIHAQLSEILHRFHALAAASYPQLLEQIANLLEVEQALYLPSPGQALAMVLAAVCDPPQPNPAELRVQLMPVLREWKITVEAGNPEQAVDQIANVIEKMVMSTLPEQAEACAIWIRRWVLLYQWEERIEAEDAVKLLLYLHYKLEHEQHHPAAYQIPQLGTGERTLMQLLSVYLGITVPVAIPIQVVLALGGVFGPKVFAAMQTKLGEWREGEFPAFEKFCDSLEEAAKSPAKENSGEEPSFL